MVGVDCISPARHSAFATPDRTAAVRRAGCATLSGGKPTGFKLAIGHPWEWFGIVKAMLETGITPDFIVVDGSRRRHRRRAAGIHRPCRRAAARRLDARPQHAGRREPARQDPHRRAAARSSPRSISPARWRSARTGATRRAASCSRSAACRRRRAIPATAPPASPRRTRSGCARWCVGDKAERVFNFHESTLARVAGTAGGGGPRIIRTSSGRST